MSLVSCARAVILSKFQINFLSGAVLSEDLSNNKRAYLLPPKRTLPDNTREKLRQRKYRSRLQNLSRFVGPLKVLGFTLIIISLCYLSLVQLKHIFFGTSYFELKKIEVSGNSYLTKNSVLKIAGIAPGLNVLLIDRDGIKQRLLGNPFIKSAEVKLEGLYNLRLLVDERKPFLYAKVGASFLEIASDGVVMSIRSTPDFNFPIITGLNLETSRPGDSLLDNDGFFTARKWINFLGPEILSQLSEINLFSLQNPYVYLLSGEKVFPRSLEDFKKRYLFLRALLDNLRKNNVEPIYLDMRAPSEIVVRPRNKK